MGVQNELTALCQHWQCPRDHGMGRRVAVLRLYPNPPQGSPLPQLSLHLLRLHLWLQQYCFCGKGGALCGGPGACPGGAEEQFWGDIGDPVPLRG